MNNNFEKFGICFEIIKSLNDLGLIIPTKIQEKVIPHIIRRKNVLIKAPTGTGKTAAFIIPLLQLNKDIPKSGNPFILVMVPTRELAIQISDNFKKISKNLHFSITCFVGGVSEKNQIKKINKGLDIVVSTPGRLCDFIRNKIINLSNIKYFVLDEVDLILDMGFIKDISFIYNSLNKKNLQTIFLSATVPIEIKNLASKMLKNYVEENIDTQLNQNPLVKQTVFFVHKNNKKNLLLQMINKNFEKTFIVFSNYKKRTDELFKFLNLNKIKCCCLHGDKNQFSRQKALNDFKNNLVNVLIATDVAARGIDIDKVNYVVNYDIPDSLDIYIHRMGRTGRANNIGECFNICEEKDLPHIKEILKHQTNRVEVFLNENKEYENIIFHNFFDKKWLIQKDSRISKNNSLIFKQKKQKFKRLQDKGIVLSKEFANETRNWKEIKKYKKRKN